MSIHPEVKAIPFTRPSIGPEEEQAVLQVLRGAQLGGDGPACRRAEALLREQCGVKHALLTTSCTHALELALLALGIGPGDEVILPSFTFTSTANAIALRGARPVFVDIDARTWNMDPASVEAALTPRTRALLPVHYAGQGCDMQALQELARRRRLHVVEDAAQGLGARWQGRSLGAFGDFGCLSFHNTKNVVCGEGGALLCDDPDLARRAEILREKGTNRSAFFRGEVDKYTWVDVGSSYVLSDLLGAVLEVQLRRAAAMQEQRRIVWARYHQALEAAERAGAVQRPHLRPEAESNWHNYAFVMEPARRAPLLAFLKARGVGATFHYVPLHTAPAARGYGTPPRLPVTERVAEGLVRLPLFPDLTGEDQERVIAALLEGLSRAG